MKFFNPLCETPDPARRAMLVGGGTLFAWACLPRFAHAAGGRDPRFVVIVLRGALDGLSTIGPIGDPDYAGLHGDIALSLDGPHPALPLDGFFVANPAMANFARMFRAGQAAVVHAAATGYRERSHFDGQDVLESGYPGPSHTATGWLNRALSALPGGDRVGVKGGLAVGTSTPLVMRGGAPVLGWAPQRLPESDDDLADRVLDLYTHRDPPLASALRHGLDASRMAAGDGMDAKSRKGGAAAAMREAAEGAARLMAADDGPRIAALAFDGWDTHVNEGGATGRLAMLLGGLDEAFATFQTGLGPRWKDTTVVAITEFGRTARINGTVGTDHGTGTVMLLAGGAIKGGRVIADWPGLKPAQLYQGRDLAPTTDVRSVLKGLLADQFGLSASVLSDKVFPDSQAVKPMGGLLA